MATRSAKKPKLDDLQGQPDPQAPLDWQLFLSAAQPVLKLLNDDLRARAKGSVAVAAALEARHAAEKEQKRTGDSFVEWQDRFIEQVAAAWLLSCVFVRTLEDRGLLGHNRLAGPGAADSLKLFLELAPSLNERDYLLTIFRELTRFPATRELFDARHNPVWLLTPSADGAKALVQLFQQPRADVPAFRFGQSDTGFLGWLYQDLDAGVRERFALLQTPRFVESFILDRTLEPAIEKFGLDDTTLIDPTCGSGHFLLGAFERLFEHRLRKEPGLSARETARKALDAVYGADLNPYAVGIARFRLTLAFLDKAGFTALRTAPSLPLHVVVGDSLLHNPHVAQPDFADLAPTSHGWRGEEFALEDEATAREVLHRTYAAVVGNPPYIVVRDRVLRQRYAQLYPSCQMNYALTVPFMERFFQLARSGGRVGQITSNSFMKRDFGKKLIERFLPTVNLDLVINTSGAYVPGHGTPTVLMFGSAEPPKGTSVPTVLASRGEPSTPSDPEQGRVWRSIAEHFSDAGFENDFISVASTERATLAKHPWSLGGGGAAELKELLEERAGSRLHDAIADVGFSIIIGEDELFLRPFGFGGARSLPTVPIVVGENVRDWSLSTPDEILRPFSMESLTVAEDAALMRELWPWRRVLEGRIVSGSTSMKAAGKAWFDVRRLSRDKHATPTSITFAFVATHNHFVLDRGGKVFNRSAPIIKLSDTATEDDHFALLAYLNSSTACFWMKQVFYPKGGDQMGDGGRLSSTTWQDRFEFAGTGLQALPLPAGLGGLASFGARLDELAQRRSKASPINVIAREPAASLAKALREAERETRAIEQSMVQLQEALDWETYRLFGLHTSKEACDVDGNDNAGARAFERVLWQSIGGEGPDAAWWQRGGYAVPHADTSPTQTVRIALAHKGELKLVEAPDFKRWWRPIDWKHAVAEAVTAELLDRVEALAHEPSIAAARTMAMRLGATSNDLLEVAAEHRVHDVATLIEDAAVPYIAPLRFTDGGLDRYAEWERTWDLQRREDAGEKIDHIPVPPKYGQGDYRSTTTWQLRGPLDVPKERFISYPGCESDEDGEPVYGWAGWDHEQRARALATLYVNRRDQESWSKDRLTPMLAGLLELLPWLKQWHGAASDDYAGVSPAAYYEGFLDEECRKHGLTRDDLRAWRPPEKARGKKAAKAKGAAASEGAADGDGAEKPKKRGRKKAGASMEDAT